MKRRDFLKTTALASTAIVTAPVVANAKQKAAPEAVKTPLKVSGYVTEPARRIPVVDSADVVVVGGGPAGFAAALSAARQGVTVLLLERQYFLGGLFTGCGVTPIINMYNPTKSAPVKAVGGICEELVRRLDMVGMVNYEKVRPKVDPEAAKYFMEEMASEAAVRMLYGVQVAEVTTSGDRIDTVILETKSRRVAVRAKFVIDCSGDGDILEWTGEDFNVYHEDIGAMWRIGNAAASPKGNPTAVKGVLTRHTVGEKKQDGLDVYNLTRIQQNLRKMMWDDAAELRKAPGCQDLFLLDTPSVVGVRITRVLNSVLNVSAQGAAEGRFYNDVIGFAGADSTLTVGDARYPNGTRPIWQVPYRSLVPKRVPNLLVAGRCFGFERPLTYDAREVGTCFMTGQAAGTASALAVIDRCSSREVNVEKLQFVLRAQGAVLGL